MGKAFILIISLIISLPIIGDESIRPGAGGIYIIPVRDDIMPPLVYLIRRGIKEAMEANAKVLVLDMDTNGGRVDVTEEVIKLLERFKGQTITYVNKKAFSAGMFIAVATKKIYMAEGSVIGAAAPIMLLPGVGPEKLPDTVEEKMTSGISALVRATAARNGHNVAVVDAMIDKNSELIIDGQVIKSKGRILTLTNLEAEKKCGNPPTPLFSSGTVNSLDELIKLAGFDPARAVYIQPLGAEKFAFWINSISALLLTIGILGLYIEFKTPGFGLPGIIGITAFLLYFFGGYVAGLAGIEWVLLFIVGLILIGLEILVFPGTAILGILGLVSILISVLMAGIDIYPDTPIVPNIESLSGSIKQLLIAFGSAIIGGILLRRFLPHTNIYQLMVSKSASGAGYDNELASLQQKELGLTGIAISDLRPGGKAQFGDKILDVITNGELISKGARVKIIGHSGTNRLVEETKQ